MSLVGNLEDLNLGDILQIVSLSRKSGTLQMRSGPQRGRIVLIEGQVRGGSVDGEPATLRDIVVDGGFMSEEEFKLATDSAASQGVAPEEMVAQNSQLDRERLESLRREQVENAVFLMLGWRTGTFNFEVRGEGEPVEADLLLGSGINAQYLAMEATRIGDEGPEPAESTEPDVEEPVFSGEELSEAVPVSDDLEQVAGEPLGPAQTSEDDETASCGAAFVAGKAAAPPVAEPPVTAAAAPKVTPPLVLVDPELLVLEWTKTTLAGRFERIHGFQDVEAGIARVRQYLARLVRPVVLLGAETGTAAQTRQWIQRLQRLAPDMPVLLLRDARRRRPSKTSANAVVERPPIHELANRRRWTKLEAAGAALCEALVPWGAEAEVPAPAADTPELAAAARGAELLCGKLRHPTPSDDVLSLVLDFASSCFARVAIFMVRDGFAVGMAERGLAKCGGPDAEGLRQLHVPLERPPCVRNAIEQRRPQLGSPTDEGDRRLAERLGNKLPTDMFLGPIESGGEVAALLYADNLPEFRRVGETGPVDRVLREAGRALDRALLERAGVPDGAPDACD